MKHKVILKQATPPPTVLVGDLPDNGIIVGLDTLRAGRSTVYLLSYIGTRDSRPSSYNFQGLHTLLRWNDKPDLTTIEAAVTDFLEDAGHEVYVLDSTGELAAFIKKYDNGDTW